MLNKEYKIYITLDSITDTVLGTVQAIDFLKKTNFVYQVLSRGYLERDSNKLIDLVPTFPQEEFDTLYKNRNVKNLMLSEQNCMLPYIKNIYEEVHVNSFYDGANLSIILNTYPYLLTTKEEDIFVEIIKNNIGNGEVKVIHSGYKNITFSFMNNEQISLAIIHNIVELYECLKDNVEEFKKEVTCKNTSIVFPRIIQEKSTHDSEIQKRGLQIMLNKIYKHVDIVDLSFFSFFPK